MGVKKSPSSCEKGPKVAASRVLSKGRCANLCNRVHKCVGTPVAIVGGQCPSLRHGGGTEASPERGSPPHALTALSGVCPDEAVRVPTRSGAIPITVLVGAR